VEIEADGVAMRDFRLVGNRGTVDRQDRAPLMRIRADDFHIERGHFIDSTKDGVMIEIPLGRAGDQVGGVVRDIVGRGNDRDVVSIDARGGGSGHLLVEHVRCFDSPSRGAVEVSDGSDDVTVRQIYAVNSLYAVDVQEHSHEEAANRNIVVQGVLAVRCRHAVRTFNSPHGHTNLTLRDVTAQECPEPLRVRNTANVTVENLRVIGQVGDAIPVMVRTCRGVSLRDVVLQDIRSDSMGILLQDCDQVRVDGLTLRGDTGRLSSGICYRLTDGGSYSGLRITGVSTPSRGGPGIVLCAAGAAGTLSDYVVSGNACSVEDRIRGPRGVVRDNAADR
jgi:hypothetical protein